jgi:hypothetical protein
MSEKYLAVFGPWLAGRPGLDGECRAYCPNCENPETSKSPSASFNFKVEVWHCMSCGKGGSFRTLVRVLKNRGDSPAKPKQKANDEPNLQVVLPTAKQLRLWHKNLMGRAALKKSFQEKRGLTDESLKQFLIGWDGQRYTIPIYGEDGELVNVRRYKPNARDHAFKMISYAKGSGSARLDGLDILAEHDEVLLCEGELDRRLGVQEGLPAVGHTGGAKTFKLEWAKHFKGKIVYIGYDEDPQGDSGADTATKVLKETARAVYRVKWGTGINGGDLTDFLHVQGHDAEDVRQRMAEASPLFEQVAPREIATSGMPITVEESKNPNHKDPVELTAMVSGILDPPYYAPKRVLGTCDQSAGVKCNGCPFTIADGKREINIERDDERLLKFLDATDTRKKDLLASLTDARCKSHVEFEEVEAWPVEVMAITPSVAHRSDKPEPPTQRLVYNVGTYRTPVNHLARIVGKTMPDPRSQRALFMGWQLEQVETDLDTFTMTPAIMARLKRFQVAQGQSPLEKCMEIADDIAANVSQIYGRPLLHVGYDLVWHSLTSFMFEGKPVIKGWLECLVIGDTRTGKSETAQALIKHYNTGVLHSLESASYAGLIGGAAQAGNNQWMVTWGLVPLNDRRLMVLDEMSGMFTSNRGESKGIIEGMSSVRSEGKAQVNKIASGEASARTRLIWISNPLSATSLADSSTGCLGPLQELVRNPEDIARYDFVMAVASNDVPSATINSTKHRKVRHRYTAQASRDLVMWVWSRKAEDVKFLKGVEEFIYAAAEDLGSRYVNDPPLVQIANVRVKVARLAVALAARTFSTDRTGQKVVVKRAHVKSAVQFLDTVYSQRAMGYQRHSAKEHESRKKAEKAKVETRKYLKNLPSVVDVLIAIGGTEFRQRDFEEFGGLDHDEAVEATGRLVRWQMIRRKSKGYMVMQPALVELLRELEDEGA